MIQRMTLALIVLVFAIACGTESAPSPTATTPAPVPEPTGPAIGQHVWTTSDGNRDLRFDRVGMCLRRTESDGIADPGNVPLRQLSRCIVSEPELHRKTKSEEERTDKQQILGATRGAAGHQEATTEKDNENKSDVSERHKRRRNLHKRVESTEVHGAVHRCDDKEDDKRPDREGNRPPTDNPSGLLGCLRIIDSRYLRTLHLVVLATRGRSHLFDGEDKGRNVEIARSAAEKIEHFTELFGWRIDPVEGSTQRDARRPTLLLKLRTERTELVGDLRLHTS